MGQAKLAAGSWMYSREEGLAVLLEVGLVGVKHAVEPWEELLGAVVSVEDDRAVHGISDLAGISSEAALAVVGVTYMP